MQRLFHFVVWHLRYTPLESKMGGYAIRINFENEGVKLRICKDQNNGDLQFMIHPPRQRNHIIPSSYSDQKVPRSHQAYNHNDIQLSTILQHLPNAQSKWELQWNRYI